VVSMWRLQTIAPTVTKLSPRPSEPWPKQSWRRLDLTVDVPLQKPEARFVKLLNCVGYSFVQKK